MRVLLLWVVVGLSAIAFAQGATTRKVHSTSTTASLSSTTNATQTLPVSTSTTVDIVPKSQTTKTTASTKYQGIRASPKILRVQRSTTHQSKPSETLVTAATLNPTTAKPSRKPRNRHARRRNRLSHRIKAAGKSPLPVNTYNLTSSATQDAGTKTAAAVEEPSIKPQETGSDPEANQNYAAQDEYYNTEKPPGYYTYSLSSSYSAKLGAGPEFASSENYAARPQEDYEGAESNSNVKRDDHQPNPAETKSEQPKRNCKYMQKPMPAYIHYGDQVEKTGANDQGPMMTCYVCGTKDEPYAYGGFTEECSYSPSKNKNLFADYDRGQSQFADQPYLSSGTTTDKLYAGKGQTPYLTVGPEGSHGSQKAREPSYDPYYDDGYYGHENEPQATSHSGKGADYDGGAATEKETCKISYRGKMKCKICGDPKSDAIFSEQCDYEKDDPNQQRTRSYDYGTGSEKSYKSPSGGKGGHGDSGDSGYGGGHGGYGGGNGGYGDDGYGNDNYGYNYPDYGGYGSGTGYGPSYDSYPYFLSHYGGGPDGSYDDDSKHGSGDTGGSNYGDDKHGGSGGSQYGDDKHGGSGGSQYGDEKHGSSGGSHGSSGGDDGKYSGTRQSNDYVPEQPEASSTHISDKKGSSTEPEKKICKVVYKDYTPYSPYSNSNSKSKESKPKMKCMVCTRSDGFGGVSEECSYSGVGETTTRGNFPGSKDISSFFGSPDLDNFYTPNFDEYHDSFF